MYRIRYFAAAVVVAALASSSVSRAQPPAPPPTCEDQLKLILKHDQEIQAQRNQLEIRVASLAAQLDDVNAKLAAATKPASPAPAAPVATPPAPAK